QLRSFSVKQVDSFLRNQYTRLAAVKTSEQPTAGDLAAYSAFGAISATDSEFRNTISELQQVLTTVSPAKQPAAGVADLDRTRRAFASVKLFQDVHERSRQDSDRLLNVAEFNDIIASLASYP